MLKILTRRKYEFLSGNKPRIRIKANVLIHSFGSTYCIPKGLISDGASVPYLIGLIINRFDERLLLYSVFHDYCYQTQFMPRALADLIYKLGLEKTYNKYVATSFYIALRAFGWIAWYNHKRKGLNQFPEYRKAILGYYCNVKKE